MGLLDSMAEAGAVAQCALEERIDAVLPGSADDEGQATKGGVHTGSHWIVCICVELRKALVVLRRLPGSSGPLKALQLLRAAQKRMAETRCCTHHNQQQEHAAVKQEERLSAWLRVLDETEVLEGYGCSAEDG